MHTTPVSLLERLRLPDQDQAWSQFVELYGPLLYYWARGHSLGESDAADLVQEVLLVLVRKMPSFTYQRDGSFRSWLRTVTLNKWRELQRRKKPQYADMDLDQIPTPKGDGTLEELEYQRLLVRHTLGRLRGEFYASVWALFDDHVGRGLPPQKVADKHNVSLGAVYAAKSKVMTRLRQELAGLVD